MRRTRLVALFVTLTLVVASCAAPMAAGPPVSDLATARELAGVATSALTIEERPPTVTPSAEALRDAEQTRRISAENGAEVVIRQRCARRERLHRVGEDSVVVREV